MLTRLCIKEPMEGNLKGTCYVCGSPTQKGHKSAISDAFTGYSYLTHGDCACEYCYSFFKNKTLRMKSWVATEKETRFIKRDEARKLIANPPEPPFFFYLTQGTKPQRQGWLDMLRFVNHSRERFKLSTEKYGGFFVKRENVAELLSLAADLRKYKIGKKVMRTGIYGMGQYKRAILEGWDDLLERGKSVVGTPLWEVVVNLAE